MNIIIIILIIISICLGLLILYLIGYNKLSIIKAKMDSANDIITNTLKEKYELMNSLYTQIKKVIKKKDYLKDFNSLKINKLGNYEFDIKLNDYYKTMIDLKEDNKNLNTKEFDKTLSKIENLDELLIANKKYFNKNNNLLSKELKGYLKLIAKINKIKIQTSYEIK